MLAAGAGLPVHSAVAPLAREPDREKGESASTFPLGGSWLGCFPSLKWNSVGSSFIDLSAKAALLWEGLKTSIASSP